MADLIITRYEPAGAVSTAVQARTPNGEVIQVVIPTASVGEVAMWRALQAAAAAADARAAALAARKGRTDSEET